MRYHDKPVTYRFTHAGTEYTRTTQRVYTHAALLSRTYTLLPSADNSYAVAVPCDPYVFRVCYGSSLPNVFKAIARYAGEGAKAWEVIDLKQPA